MDSKTSNYSEPNQKYCPGTGLVGTQPRPQAQNDGETPPTKTRTTQNQRINGDVNAHLISGPSISTKHTK